MVTMESIPPELCAAMSSNVDVAQLVDIVRVSNKYCFKTLEVWALDAIHHYVNCKPSPISGTSIQVTAQLTRLVRLAHMCNHGPLLNTMIEHLQQLMTVSLQYAYLAMTLADELDLRTLRGLAYFEVLRNGFVPKRARVDKTASQAPDVTVMDPKEGEVDEKGRLVVNSSQQFRLLSGYYRLTRSWEKFRSTGSPFYHSASCSASRHQHICVQTWGDFWNEKKKAESVLAFGLEDVVGRMTQIQKEFEEWVVTSSMYHECKNNARTSFHEAIKKTQDTLPDFFSEIGGDI